MSEVHSPEHYRLFIALAVPEFVKTRIQATQDQLRASLNRAAVRWTKPDQFHLTLRFLGNVDAASAEALVATLGSVCERTYSLDLRAAGIGFFPNAKAPRVLWVGIEEAQQRLFSLQQAVQQATLRFTTETAEDRFSGHITLARIKHLNRREANLLARTAERFSATLFGEWTTHELHLMRSRLSAAGAHHTILAVIPLSLSNHAEKG